MFILKIDYVGIVKPDIVFRLWTNVLSHFSRRINIWMKEYVTQTIVIYGMSITVW